MYMNNIYTDRYIHIFMKKCMYLYIYRYITLAPVAGVVGLAFNLKDPNGLLKGVSLFIFSLEV